MSKPLAAQDMCDCKLNIRLHQRARCLLDMHEACSACSMETGCTLFSATALS